MPNLETVLLELYLNGDPRVSLLSWFQEERYVYVKMVINDGKHDVIIEKIREVEITRNALNATIQSALEKAAAIIMGRELISIIERVFSDPV